MRGDTYMLAHIRSTSAKGKGRLGEGRESAFKSKAVNPRFWVKTNGLGSILSLHGLLGRGQEFPIWGDSPSVESKRKGICLAGSGLRRVLGHMDKWVHLSLQRLRLARIHPQLWPLGTSGSSPEHTRAHLGPENYLSCQAVVVHT